MKNLQKQKKYKIFLYENINGLGCLGDQGFSFDTWSFTPVSHYAT